VRRSRGWHIFIYMLDDKYRPRTFEEMADDPTPVTLINEPLPPDNVRTIVRAERTRPLPAVLCEALTNTQALADALGGGRNGTAGSAARGC
jgi:hypothetical protein